METSYSLSEMSDTDDESITDYSPPRTAHWVYDTGIPGWINFQDGTIEYDHQEEAETDSESDSYSQRSYSSDSDWSTDLEPDERFSGPFLRFQ